MPLTPTLKAVLLTLPLIAATGCSKKPVDQCEEATASPMTTVEIPAEVENQLYVDDQERQLEELKKSNVVHFGYDKYGITSEFAQILDEHADLLRNNPSYRVLIEGHTDERGTPEYNIALGERRATAVAMYLQGNGVSEQQITIVSYGQESPCPDALGHNEAAYAKNRRAVLVY